MTSALRKVLPGKQVVYLVQEDEHGLAGNALQDPAGDRRGDDPALPHDQQAGPGALGDLAPVVEKDRPVVAAHGGLHGRQP